MNTVDAIQALKAGDFNGLLAALDVDQKDTVDMTSVGGPVVTVARIGLSLVTVTPDGNAAITSVPEGMDPGFAFYAAIQAGNDTVREARDAQRHQAGSALPLGFTV